MQHYRPEALTAYDIHSYAQSHTPSYTVPHTVKLMIKHAVLFPGGSR